MSVDVLSSFLPVALLRPLSRVLSAAATAPNRALLVDPTILVLTSVLAGDVFLLSLALAYGTFLPTTLVLYFNGIPSVEAAHAYSATPFFAVAAGAQPTTAVLCAQLKLPD